MHETVSAKYARLSASRTNFLDAARECAKLSVPYLMPPSGHASGDRLHVPWQSQGSRGVNTMAAKLMLSLFPVNAKFFKLQIQDGVLSQDPDIDAQARSEIDLVLSKMERVVMQDVADKADRVMLHQAMKHLVVAGNVLVFMGKKGLKIYPLDRYVVNRDGDGQVTEIITVEAIDAQFLPEKYRTKRPGMQPGNHVGEQGGGDIPADLKLDSNGNDVAVYTCVKLVEGTWRWYQEVDGEIIEGSESSAPKNASPYLALRFNVVDGEDYGRSRIDEFRGDLQSLDALMQSLVEGSAAAAKVVFTLSPSATTKPNQLAQAGNGAIIQGRPDDVGVIQSGKQADFRTAFDMVQQLTQRLSEAFLIFTARNSERTTAEEIRATQQELNEQLGGILSSLQTDLLAPYIARKLLVLQRQRMLPQLPKFNGKPAVFPTVVAGLEGVGRGQDREALMLFMQTIAQTLGPEAMSQYINPDEAIKRLAAAAGIDYLGLVKTNEQLQQEAEAQQQAQQQEAMLAQAGQLAKSPLADPDKNPQIRQALEDGGEETPEGIPEESPIGPEGA